MNCIFKMYSRIFQKVLYVVTFFLPWRQPKIFENDVDFAKQMKSLGHKKVLLVTDSGITKIGLYNDLVETIKKEDIEVAIYDETIPNPTILNIEHGLQRYKDFGASAIIGFGGGSSVDCAKGIAARVAKPKKPVSKMKGLFKILKRLPDLFIVPTTAGSGSETTVAAVITDSEKGEKYSVTDISLIPRYALLEAKLMTGLPSFVTATTGMDALCHAVEAYTNRANTSKTKRAAEQAVKLIYENLYEAYSHPTNLEARGNMSQASFKAGVAFTRGYVGNVHALSHALSAKYHTAHGLANAVLLPVVLKWYGKKAHKKLAKLSEFAGITGDTIEEKAQNFIDSMFEMNAKMQIPTVIDTLKEEDFAFLSNHAYKEANPMYPVPVMMSREDAIELYTQILP